MPVDRSAEQAAGSKRVFKDYPVRRGGTKTCECGHGWFYHDFGFFRLVGAKCSVCLCPQFKSVGWVPYRDQK